MREPLKSLKIHAPDSAKVNEEVEITVTNLRGSPVEGASVSFVKLKLGETIDSVKDALESGKIGTKIGYTDSNGKIRYAFGDWGSYVIYASKERYVGAFTSITVVQPSITVVPPSTTVVSLGKLYVASAVLEWTPGVCSFEDLARMSVEEALEKCSQKVKVLIKVTDEKGKPIDGAKVTVRKGLESLETTTNLNGEATVELQAGVYFIVAEKKGYAWGIEAESYRFEISADEIRERVREKIEEAESKVSREIEGVVIRPSGYLKEVINEFVKENAAVETLPPDLDSIYILLSKDLKAIVISSKTIPEAKVKLKGFGLEISGQKGEWAVFYAKDFEIIDDKGIYVTVSDVLRDPERYKFELLNFSTHCRSIALTLVYEETGLPIPISVGYVSDTERTSFSFIERLVEKAGEFNRSERFTRSFIEEKLEFGSKERIATFRLKTSYWFDSDSFVKGVLIDLPTARALKAFIPAKAIDIIAPEKERFFVLEIERIPKAEFVSIEEIRKNPEKFEGKLVAFYSVGEGFNVSTNQVIEKAAKLAAAAFPALEPVAATAEANPVDVIIQAEARWYPVVPSNRFQILPTVAALNYDGKPKLEPVEPVNEVRVDSTIYGYVITRERAGFEYPIVVIQDKKFNRYIEAKEIAEELRKSLEDIKERIKERVERQIKTGAGLKIPENICINNVCEIEQMAKIRPPRPELCPAVYNPVCGVDGRTYSNLCEAWRSGVFVACKGECPCSKAINLTIQHFVEIKPGESVTVQHLKEMTLTLKPKEIAKNVQIVISKLEEIPEEVKRAPGLVYACYDISPISDDTLKVEGKISFRVEKSWIIENNVDAEKIRLARYHEDWEILATVKISEDQVYVYYEAEVPGFSIFAVVAESGEAVTPTATPATTPIKETPTPTPVVTPKPTPGFEAIFAVAGLIVVAYLLRR